VILEEAVINDLFNSLQDYALIDALLASAESRRAATLREIERWRDTSASRLRKASEQVIDAEIIDNLRDPASPGREPSKMIPKNALKVRRDGAAAAPTPLTRARDS
jgi:hypothetical protein